MVELKLRYKLRELYGIIDELISIVGDCKILFFVIDKFSKQEIVKDIIEVSSIIN